MSKETKRRPTPPSGKPTPTVVSDAVEAFGKRLHNLLVEKGMSQSDLARLVFAETRTDNRGYGVVVGKDRISSYIRGKTTPSPQTLKKIADALRTTPEELAPDLAAESIANANPEILISTLAGHHNMALLKINKLVPMKVAIQITNLIAEWEDQKKQEK